MYSLSNTIIFNCPTNSVPLSIQFFLGRFFSVILVEKTLTVSLESFVFFPFASTVRSNKFWRTSNYFTPSFFFCQFISKSKIHTPSLIFEPSKSLRFLEFSFGRINFCLRSLHVKIVSPLILADC